MDNMDGMDNMENMGGENDNIPESEHKNVTFSEGPPTFKIDHYTKNNGGVLEFHANIFLEHLPLNNIRITG